MSAEPSRIEPAEFEALVRQTIPLSEVFDFGVERMVRGEAALRMRYSDKLVRHGGTVSGPALMTLADTALYAACLSELGPEAAAVTTDLSFHFLRRPGPEDLRAVARLLKVGARLLVGEVHLYSGDDERPVAHAVGSYAVPPKQS